MKKEIKAHFILPESGFRRVMSSPMSKTSKSRDKLLFVVSSLYCYQYKNFNPDYKGFIPLHSSILKKFLGNHSYTSFIKELMRLGMIERSGLYVPSHISRGYRLKEPFRSDKPILIQAKDKVITNKLIATRTSEEQLLTDVDCFLFKNLKRISFRVDDGLEQIKTDLELNEAYTQYHFNSDFVSIVELADENFRLTRDQFGNRAHHNLTNMRSSLKKFLRVDGKNELVGLDIANSQPFLFNVILRKMYPSEIPEDVEHYIDLTSNGSFYSYLKEHLNNNKGIKQIKKEFFGKVFFSRNFIYGRINANDYTQFMETHFPNVFKVIQHCKRTNHNELAKALQQIESHIIIDTILKRVNECAPNVFGLCIHDEILCKKSDVDFIKMCIIDGFKQFSLTPMIKEKNYSY